MHIEVPFIKRLTIGIAAFVGEVRIGPNTHAEVAEVNAFNDHTRVTFEVALESRLGVDERSVKLIAGVDTVATEAPEGETGRFFRLSALRGSFRVLGLFGSGSDASPRETHSNH